MPGNTQVINQRQLCWLVGSLLIGGGLLSIQHELVRVAHMDTWFVYLLPTVYILFIAYVFAQLSMRFPGKHLFEINFILFGRWFGMLANALLLIHLWFILLRDLRMFGKFIGTILLPNTPEEMLVLLLVVMLMFYGRASAEVISRVNDLFFPVFFALTLLLPFLLSNEISFRLLQPILTTSPLRLGYGGLLSVGWYGDIIIAGAFLHMIWNSRQIHSALRHGSLMATALLSLFLFLEVAVLGPNIPANLLYPNYSLVQHIQITDFLDRMDLLILSIWFPIIVGKMIFIYLAFLIGIASLIRQRDYTLISSPAGLFLLLTTILAFKSTPEVFSFGNYSSPVIVLSYQPVLLAAMLLLMRRFPKRNPEHHEEGSSEKKQGHDRTGMSKGGNRHPGKRLGTRLGAVSSRTWLRTGNVLLALGFVFVGAGLLFSRNYAVIGTLAGFGYALVLALLLFVTHMEMRKAKDLAARSAPNSARTS
ncbi:GerAB/ArcD/ProY family transporter [Paenibacillus ehimensis]|uniref:Endospore germination permease n=1 Tax=Paenibacillus ehimensis TaxID=79264 RepID=A0ABT8VK47_9BACL|nr:endospore germination permease [Paenibacillus ehimensis]MDO3681359.1 endospore germination permease [Paenibacillus ehimensis]MEC0213609.1 endospore germination permease [Paenibacillus ehimensis]